MIFLFACGGSGGHIFPAISVGQELEKTVPGSRVFYVCGTRDIENKIFKIVPENSVFSVKSAPFRGAFSFFDPRFLIKLIQGYFEAAALLKKTKPAIVVGFGGYVSFPMLIAAKTMGIKTALHEQNVVPGRANRVLSRFVDAVALSHQESQKRFRRLPVFKITGNPIRASIEEGRRDKALGYFGFSENKKTLLILGGSQGAESVNHFFLSCLPYLKNEIKEKIQALHLCGKMEPLESEKQCSNAGVQARAYSFFDKMDFAYAAADFCVGRAGATFLAEIEVKNIPAVLIPYPFADGHQRENARVYAAKRPAIVAEQSELTAQKLADIIERFVLDNRINSDFNLNASKVSGSGESPRKLMADFIISCAKN